MFWKCNHNSSPHIETLLNVEDATLHDFMDDEDVLQECKVQNKKLIDYLVRPNVMEELVTLITVEPSGEVDERARYKYPNIACELLTCDVPALNERLAGDEALLGKLYAFLESEKPLNPLLASFFSKTIGVLVARKSEQNWYSYQFTCLQVLEFLKSKENCISLLLKHLGTSAIMDLMLKLITNVEGVEMQQNILNWLDSQRVVQCLVMLLDPSIDEERHCNASQLLCDVVKKSREYQATSTERMDPDPVLNTLESPETVSLLLEQILGPQKCESSIVGGISVLLTLLECGHPMVPGKEAADVYGTSSQGEETGGGESEQPSKVVLSTAAAILPRLKDIHALLIEPPPKPAVKTTAGTLDPPLGNTRLHVAKLCAALIATSSAEINKELANLGTIEVLLDLFFKYTWNNFLHSQVEQCLAFALNSELNATSGKEPPDTTLLDHVFSNCKLLQRILEAWDENESQQLKAGGRRRGYMGHLIRIANNIAQTAERGPLGTFIKEHVAADTLAAWEAFVANTLAETNKTHQICLGGTHPVHSNSEDDDQDYRDIPFPQDAALQQVFADYQMQQVAPQFIENFGFRDDEFTDGEDTLHASVDRLTSMTFNVSDDDLDQQAELFKQVCAQKLQALEDGEEDMWDERENELTFQTVVGRDNSSDEEERPEVHMEVDSTEPWTAETSSEAAVALVAVDADNPWSRNDPSPAPDPIAPEPASWADFSSAGFADFDANFGSASDPNNTDTIAAATTTTTTSTTSASNTTTTPTTSPTTTPSTTTTTTTTFTPANSPTNSPPNNPPNSPPSSPITSPTTSPIPITATITSTTTSTATNTQEAELASTKEAEVESCTATVGSEENVSTVSTEKPSEPASTEESNSVSLPVDTAPASEENVVVIPDDNANPSALGREQEQLIDNYRFLSSQGLIGDAKNSLGGHGEGTKHPNEQPEEEVLPKENGPTPEELSIVSEKSSLPTLTKQGEACTSHPSPTTAPNGPV